MRIKRILEERWGMVRCISEYISTNQEGWERGKMERELERRRKIEELEKMKIFKKIEFL